MTTAATSDSTTKRLTLDQGTEYDLIGREPKLVVEPGEHFVVETEDALAGAIHDESQPPTAEVFGDRLARDEFNPCSGPVFVSGSRPGDVLAVRIHDIVVGPKGVTCVFEGVGPYGDSASRPALRGPFTKVIEHRAGPGGTTADGTGVYGAGFEWALSPHIGTIATAPARPLSAGADSNYGQGPFGGNLDCRDVRPGSRVLLPVTVDGACLYVGDVHGSMGDGELYGVGDESRAMVTLSCEVLRRRSIPFARIETDDALIQLNSTRPLEDGIAEAFRWMLDWLVDDHGLDERDAYVLLGIHPEVRINVYQMVRLGRLNCTVGVSFPKSALPEDGGRR